MKLTNITVTLKLYFVIGPLSGHIFGEVFPGIPIGVLNVSLLCVIKQ